MKTIKIIPALLASFVLLISQVAMANDEKFIEAMLKNIEAVYSGHSSEEIQNAINAFDRIGEAEKTKWEPFYYSSFGYVMMANLEKEAAKKDTYLDLALKGG